MVRLVITVVPACWESRIKICSTGGGLRKTQRVETRESSYQNDSALQEKGESYEVLPRRNAKITGVRARTLGLMSEISKQSRIDCILTRTGKVETRYLRKYRNHSMFCAMSFLLFFLPYAPYALC